MSSRLARSGGPIRPLVAVVAVQAAALVLALGRPSVVQAGVAGLATVVFLLANDARGWLRARAAMVVGAAVATVAAMLAACLPGSLRLLGPAVLVALYLLGTVGPFVLPRMRTRGTSVPEKF